MNDALDMFRVVLVSIRNEPKLCQMDNARLPLLVKFLSGARVLLLQVTLLLKVFKLVVSIEAFASLASHGVVATRVC